MAEGFDCFRLQFPKGMDANEYACTVKPAEKSLGVVIRAAQWLGSGAKPTLTTRTVSSSGLFQTPEPQTVAAEVLRDAQVLQIKPIESVALAATLARGATSEAYTAPALAVAPSATDPMPTPPATASLPEPASAAVPSLPPPEAEAKTDEQQLLMAFGERRYRVRGLPKQLGGALKVNVLVTHSSEQAVTLPDAGLHVDSKAPASRCRGCYGGPPAPQGLCNPRKRRPVVLSRSRGSPVDGGRKWASPPSTGERR